MRISDWSSDVCASDLFARAAALGITSAAIGDVVRVATVGDYDFNLPRLNLPGRQVYVRVQLNPAARAAPETIGQLTVRSDQGAAVPLDNIADIPVAGGPAQIDRYDRPRIATLSPDLEGRPGIEGQNGRAQRRDRAATVRLSTGVADTQ